MQNEILQKEYIPKAIAAFLIIITLFFVVKTVNELKTGKYIGAGVYPANTISVSGKGEVNIEPDMARFNFTVNEEADTVEEAQEAVSETISDILAGLEDLGVEDKDIKTQGYNIYPRYEYQTKAVVCPAGADCFPPSGERVLVGYEVSQNIEVKARDIENAGDILTALGSLGVDNLYGPNFEVEDQDELMLDAREKAIENARKKAERLAKDLGVTLGRIVSFNDNMGYYPYYEEMAMDSRAYGMGGDGMVMSAKAELPTGETSITSNVNIIFEIK